MTSPVTRRSAPRALASLPLILRARRTVCRLPVEREAAILDLRRLEPELFAIALQDDPAVFAYAFQAAPKDALSVDGLRELYFRVPTGETRVISNAIERPIEPRRADFEPVPAGHAVSDVESRRHVARYLRAEVEGDTSRRLSKSWPLHRQREYPTAGVGPPAELHSLHSVRTQDRFYDRDDSIAIETFEAFVAERHAE